MGLPVFITPIEAETRLPVPVPAFMPPPPPALSPSTQPSPSSMAATTSRHQGAVEVSRRTEVEVRRPTRTRQEPALHAAYFREYQDTYGNSDDGLSDRQLQVRDERRAIREMIFRRSRSVTPFSPPPESNVSMPRSTSSADSQSGLTIQVQSTPPPMASGANNRQRMRPQLQMAQVQVQQAAGDGVPSPRISRRSDWRIRGGPSSHSSSQTMTSVTINDLEVGNSQSSNIDTSNLPVIIGIPPEIFPHGEHVSVPSSPVPNTANISHRRSPRASEQNIEHDDDYIGARSPVAMSRSNGSETAYPPIQNLTTLSDQHRDDPVHQPGQANVSHRAHRRTYQNGSSRSTLLPWTDFSESELWEQHIEAFESFHRLRPL